MANTNIYEIAREAGVSIATVSRVINGTAKVSEESARKVREAIERLHYIPNATAIALSTSRSDTVSVVVPDIANPFFAAVLRGITRVADEAGLRLLLSNTDEQPAREHELLHSLLQSKLRGLIITPVSETDTQTLALLREFDKRGVPVVLLDRELHDAQFDRVVSDDREGAFRGVQTLCACGHTRIAVITGPEDSRPGAQRLQGYLAALRAAGIVPDPAYIRQGDFKSERAYEHTLKLLELPQPPTAIFASNNLTTYGCLRAFSERGLVMGRDISLIGFDDIEALRWLNFRLSVIDRDVLRMGAEAMRLLACRFDDARREHVCVTLPTQLILRGSEELSSPPVG